jgi:uncharacterized OB-fold protein
MAPVVPIVDYLVLDERPHLLAHQCLTCGAQYFDRRVGCAACSGADFTRVEVPQEGVLRAFTIVAVPSVARRDPFVAGIVDCEGTLVRTNIVNVEPTPEHVRTGVRVRLCTFSVGLDDTGREAIAYGFEPVESKVS